MQACNRNRKHKEQKGQSMSKDNKKTVADAPPSTTETGKSEVAIPCIYDNIPKELKEYPNWLVRKGKKPHSPIPPYALANKPDKCGTFKQAIQALYCGNFDGIGFHFSNTPFTGIDLDHHITNKAFDKFALNVFQDFNSYTEYSPSGTGVHIIVKGETVKPVKNSKYGIEIYSDGRYFTFTGNKVNGSPDTVEERQNVIDKYVELYRTDKKQPQKESTAVSVSNEYEITGDDDGNIIIKATEHDKSGKFKMLFHNGDTSLYGSHSEADAALMQLLAYWTNGNPVAMERLFNRSALVREKWETRADYRERTIQDAINRYEQDKQKRIEMAVQGALEGEKVDKLNSAPFWDDKKFLHNKFGRFILDQYHILRLQAQEQAQSDAMITPLMLYNPKLGIYEKAKPYIDKIIRTLLDDLKNSHVNEVKGYIDGVAPVKEIQQPQLMAVKNGILDPYTGNLMKKNPNLIVTQRMPVIYIPTQREAPELFTFFETLFGKDEAMMRLVFEVFGYGLSPTNFMQKFFMLVGSGGNGKSAFLELLIRFYGDWNVSKLPLAKFDGDRFGTAGLYGKLLNIGDDIGSEAIRDTAELKKAVSGEPLRAEFKGQDAFSFKPRAKLFFSANELPRIYDTSQGMLDRLCVIPFLNRIRGTEQADPEIINRLIGNTANTTALLNFSIDGLNRIRSTRKFTLPDIVKQYTANYFVNCNPVALFVEACDHGEIMHYDAANRYTPLSIEENTTKEVYTTYVEWAKENGYRPVANNKFGQEMRALGYERKDVMKDGGRYRIYTGITPVLHQ